MSKYPPGPKARFFGLNLAREFAGDPLGFTTQVCRTYGDIASFQLGPLRAYFVNEPRLIHELLVSKHKHFRRPPRLMRPLAKIDGNGLVLSDGDFWLRQRRLMQPAFSSKRFAGYAQAMVECTERRLDAWPATATINLADEMTDLTLDIIGRTLFGVELGDRAAELRDAVRVISESFVRDASSIVQLPSWVPLPRIRRQQRAIHVIDALIRGIIRQRRASGEDRGDLLSMLLLAVDREGDGRGMTDEQARDEAVTLFNAGHDSTAAALAWIWYAVAGHPEVENRLVEEIDMVLQGRPATLVDMPRLVFTEMVVKEAMRLYPPTWALLPREVVTELELGGYTIAPGSWIYAFPWVTHRDPRYFERPETFDPDRFAPDRLESIPQDAYFPFGGGPRVCIGNLFATMEMVLIVASVLRRFRVKLAPDQGPAEPEPLIAMRPKGGLRVSLDRRREPAYADRS